MLDFVLFFVVVLLGVIFARRYNFIHGFISLFAFAAMVIGVEMLLEKMSFLASFLTTYKPMSDMVRTTLFDPVQSFLEVALGGELKELVYICGMIGLFVASQILASMIRKSRKKRNTGNPKYRRV